MPQNDGNKLIFFRSGYIKLLSLLQQFFKQFEYARIQFAFVQAPLAVILTEKPNSEIHLFVIEAQHLFQSILNGRANQLINNFGSVQVYVHMGKHVVERIVQSKLGVD